MNKSSDPWKRHTQNKVLFVKFWKRDGEEVFDCMREILNKSLRFDAYSKICPQNEGQ